MKFTKRMKNAIIQAFFLNIIFFFIFLGIVFSSSYPAFKEYSEKKQELETVFSEYTTIQKSGLSLGGVKKAGTKHRLATDVYTSTILQDFDPVLFKKYFSNTGASVYDDFLENVQGEVGILKNDPAYIERDATISTILPVYSFGNSANQDSLSDFHFINYIERLFYTFNVSSTGEIGISSLEKVQNEEDIKIKKKDENIRENIYKIPLKFSIVGQKKNVVDFIHFLENVGSVSLISSGIQEHKDTFIARTLEGNEQDGEDYNIYKNQLSTIESITLRDYPDSGTTVAGENLIDTMKNKQSRQKFEVEIQVSFYVAGVPAYQIQKYIDDFYVNFDTNFLEIEATSQEITRAKNTYTQGSRIEVVQKLQALNLLMLSFKEEITVLRSSDMDIDEESFELFIEYNTKLDRIVTSFEELQSLFSNEV